MKDESAIGQYGWKDEIADDVAVAVDSLSGADVLRVQSTGHYLYVKRAAGSLVCIRDTSGNGVVGPYVRDSRVVKCLADSSEWRVIPQSECPVGPFEASRDTESDYEPVQQLVTDGGVDDTVTLQMETPDGMDNRVFHEEQMEPGAILRRCFDSDEDGLTYSDWFAVVSEPQLSNHGSEYVEIVWVDGEEKGKRDRYFLRDLGVKPPYRAVCEKHPFEVPSKFIAKSGLVRMIGGYL